MHDIEIIMIVKKSQMFFQFGMKLDNIFIQNFPLAKQFMPLTIQIFLIKKTILPSFLFLFTKIRLGVKFKMKGVRYREKRLKVDGLFRM